MAESATHSTIANSSNLMSYYVFHFLHKIASLTGNDDFYLVRISMDF